MGLFERVKSWFNASDEVAADDEEDFGAPRPSDPASAPSGPELERSPLETLTQIGLPGGASVDEGIAVLRASRGTPREAAAVAKALQGIGERTIPDPIRVACADILAARGDEQGALRVLEGVSSTAGLVLSSDLFAASGQLPRAIGTIERVLARDLTAPGARERHQRWSAALGYAARPARRVDEATVLGSNMSSGPFRLLREVARGGAGVVYEAEDEVLGRKVAFKVYHGRAADRALLDREVRMATSLGGAGIVRIFDANPEAGWVALEWISRGSVRDVLRAGDFEPLVPIGRWARPLARALSRVHAAGIVHADVKPANVLLRQPHDPVLTDFGIARPLGAAGEGGSPGYVSPERMAGRASDPRDDVYAYGRVLEDVLRRVEELAPGAATDAAAFDALTLACLGPDEERPRDGGDLLRRLP
jgi:eukaryotic-like serine/threonine-protein kinase